MTVQATEAITIAGQDSTGSQSGIFSRARGEGPAGNLTITTGELAMTNGRIASDTTTGGAAGAITPEAEHIRLTQGEQISGSSGLVDTAGNVLVGRGAGGDITITAEARGVEQTGSGGGRRKAFPQSRSIWPVPLGVAAVSLLNSRALFTGGQTEPQAAPRAGLCW